MARLRLDLPALSGCKTSAFKIRAPGWPADEPQPGEKAWGNGCEVRGCKKHAKIFFTCCDGVVREICPEHAATELVVIEERL